MTVRRIPVDKGYYEVDTSAKTYRFISDNKHWKLMKEETNDKNRKSLDGYTRIECGWIENGVSLSWCSVGLS